MERGVAAVEQISLLISDRRSYICEAQQYQSDSCESCQRDKRQKLTEVKVIDVKWIPNGTATIHNFLKMLQICLTCA